MFLKKKKKKKKKEEEEEEESRKEINNMNITASSKTLISTNYFCEHD